MKKQIVILTLAISPIAYADTIYGLYADANYWHTSSDNIIQTYENERMTFDNKNKGQAMISASVEHGVPLVPNVRFRYADLNAVQKNNPNLTIDATSTDLIAYYEILDNVVSVDVGLGAKRISGDTKAFGQEFIKLDKTLPMAYASAGAKLPFTGLSAKAELGLAKGSDVNATDAMAELKYNFVDKALIDVGVKAGYRVMKTEYDKVSYPNFMSSKHPYEMNFKGPYLGIEFHF